MNVDTYQTAAARTLIDEPDTTFTNDELAIMFAALELGAKVGSVLEYVKKAICHRHGFDQHTFDDLLFDTEVAITDLAQYNSVEAPDYHLTGNQQMLIWCALGLGGESGEVMDGISALRVMPVDRIALIKELGDSNWYVAGLCTMLGVSMSDVMQANIAKLQRRFPEGWGSEASKARADLQV